MGVTTVTIRDEGKDFPRSSGASHPFQLQKLHEFVMELEDLHFHHDSAVMLPDYDTESKDPAMPAEPRITALAILAECLREVQRHPTRKMFITGHADTSGDAGYNLKLSQLRATNVLSALKGQRDKWVEISLGKHKVEDYQLILKWIARDWGFPCDPGKIDNVRGQQTDDATEAFHTSYNVEFKDQPDKANPQGRTVTAETWKAFFDVYMRELAEILDVDDSGLKALRDKIQFISEAASDETKQAVGCGENFPKEKRGVDGFRSRENRRVEILFFESADPTQEPKLECHASATCNPKRCEVNNPKIYESEIIPVPPVLPRFVRLRVRLKLQWLDPDKKKHVFPNGFAALVVFDDLTSDDSSTLREQVSTDGLLSFFADKRKSKFTIQFESVGRRFIATATSATKGPGPERAAIEIELQDLLADAYFLFGLPLIDDGSGTKTEKWSLRESTWSDSQGNPTEEFNDLTKPIGALNAPFELTLDPHWQFVRFEYFDRFFGKSNHGNQRISIPQILLEGFNVVPTGTAKTSDADTISNWTQGTDPLKLLQCLPWIIQKKAGAPIVKPDPTVMLRFETVSDSFVVAALDTMRSFVVSESATSRKIEQISDATRLGPSAERLKLYDLPKVWKSTNYFTRLAGGTGKFFESLTAAEMTDSTKPDKPLSFSLDDIVFVDDTLKPIKVAAATPPPNPVAAEHAAIFSHFFSKGTPADANLTDVGIFKPDANLPWFSQDALLLTTDRNYVADYPAWTRLVAVKGSLLDVFDQRTPDANPVVGARAAVQWVDFVKTGSNFAAPGGDLGTRPLPTAKPFFTAQTFFEQNRRMGACQKKVVFAESEFGVGRFDLALVRCCDFDSASPSKEVAVCFNFFRFNFNFSPQPVPPPPAPPTRVPSNLTGGAATTYRKNATLNIPRRWNGPDPAPGVSYTHTTFPGPPTVCSVDRAQIEPTGATPNLRIEVMYFAQSFDAPAICHFSINVFQKARAFMGSSSGNGQLELKEDAPAPADPAPGTAGFPAGSFTFGHECGHAASLSDEYLETATGASYGQSPIFSNSPGSPFDQDNHAMMRGNQEVRPRYFWHIAEWLHFLDASTNFRVKHGGFNYQLPHMTLVNPPPGPNSPQSPARPFSYNHTCWPLVEKKVINIGPRGRFTLYLYPLGEEQYSKGGLVPAAKGTLNGILVVVVKIKVTLPNIAGHTPIRDAVLRIRQSIDNAFNGNRKFVASGTEQGFTFTKCLLQFQPRFVVDTFSGDANYATNMELTPPVNPGDPTFAQQYATVVQDLERIHSTAPNASAPFWGDFHVTTQSGASGFTATRDLGFQLTGPPVPPNVDFENFFAEMLGIAPASKATAAAYLPLVQQVISTNARVDPL